MTTNKKGSPYITKGIHFNKNDRLDMQLLEAIQNESTNFSGTVKKILFAWYMSDGQRTPNNNEEAATKETTEEEQPKLDPNMLTNDIFG